MKDIQIENLQEHTDLIPLLAKWHFQQWGALTGASSEQDYQKLICKYASSQKVPTTLLAIENNKTVGSVNLIESDLEIRSELTPWIAQLYVIPEKRSRGIGSNLVRAAIDRAIEFGFDTLYLYTSGTLPFFYESLGWKTREVLQYRGKERTVMEIKIPVNRVAGPPQKPR